MKGFILSAFVFVLYVILTALSSHILRPDRHFRIFLPGVIPSALVYFGGYLLSPTDLGFIPAGWLAHYPWLDLFLGFFILILNIHNYIDWFFGFNGGFSSSLLLLICRAGERGATTTELIACYRGRDGMDKIYGWRLPRLEETGYIIINKETHICTLTPKGRITASITKLVLKVLNQKEGG